MVITSCLLQHYDIIVFNCKENLKRDWNREAVKGGQSPTELDPSHPVVKVRHILSEEFYRGGYIVTFLIPPKPNLDPIISNDYVHESSSIYTLDIIIPSDIRARQDSTKRGLSHRIIICNQFIRFLARNLLPKSIGHIQTFWWEQDKN